MGTEVAARPQAQNTFIGVWFHARSVRQGERRASNEKTHLDAQSGGPGVGKASNTKHTTRGCVLVL